MSQPLRILIVEDSEDDTLLLLRELRRGGYDPIYERVETAATMQAALARQSWDIVVADFSMPHFSAPAALTLLQASGLDLPFIIVSGTVGEDVAVAAMKAGAHDYLVKGKLARLMPAIEREVREAQVRQERRQAEQALFDQDRRFRALIEHAADVIALVDSTGLITYASPSISRVLGYTPAEYVGLNAFTLLHPDDVQILTALFEQLLPQPGASVTAQFRFRHKDGSWRWAEAVGSNLLAEASVQAIIVNFRDITERKQAELETRRRNRELALLNQVIAASAAGLEPAAVLDIACRELALAFEASQATAGLLNEQKTAALIVAEYLPAYAGPSQAEARSILNQTLEVAASAVFQHLFTHKTPLVIADAGADPRLAGDRQLILRRGTISLLILPLLIKGEVIGGLTLETAEPHPFSMEEINLAWSVADQVAGALAHARLTQLHQRLSAAIEQAGESVIITDIEGAIIYVNPTFERVSGYSWAEAIGQNPQFLKSSQHDAAFYEELWSTISAGQVWHGRLINKKKDGTLYTEEATITPVRDESGALINYVSVQRDVTRELQLEEQYRQAQKMEAIGRLSGGVAHDFNNLLVVINGYSELLLDHFLDAASPVRKYIQEIKKAGERASGLTRQLLAFSRQQVLQLETLELNEVVTNTEQMLQRLIGEDIDLTTKLEPALGQVKADAGQIEQIILNLAVNARDAMPRGGKLTIETANVELDTGYAGQHAGAEPDPYVMLAVSDTGIGMDAATQARIFEPFFTTKERDQGTGLGLAMVYGIVKQSGGDIWVYSEPGLGTTFKIYLPRLDETTPLLETPLDLSADIPTGTETVLLVEDEESVRTLARRILEMSGYTVLEAEHGGEALLLDAHRQGPIHLLLTDVIMPHMGGQELAERLVALHPEMKVLYVSGYTDQAIAHHGVLDPGLFFLQKPFSPNALARKVREVLDAPQ
ncbi:MAG: PAS domain S-box protein [Chloroflexota bacterium]